jgi:hypothetical protein
MRLGEHLITLADAGTLAEVDLEPAAFGSADHLKKSLSAIFCHGESKIRVEPQRRKDTKARGSI